MALIWNCLRNWKQWHHTELPLFEYDLSSGGEHEYVSWQVCMFSCNYWEKGVKTCQWASPAHIKPDKGIDCEQGIDSWDERKVTFWHTRHACRSVQKRHICSTRKSALALALCELIQILDCWCCIFLCIILWRIPTDAHDTSPSMKPIAWKRHFPKIKLNLKKTVRLHPLWVIKKWTNGRKKSWIKAAQKPLS